MSIWTRAAATDALTEVRDLMRRVYRRVHPDLFARSPEAQAVNQRSMQELQATWEALSAATQPGPGRSIRSRVTFFVAPARTAAQESPVKASTWLSSDTSGFRRAIVDLARQVHPDDHALQDLHAQLTRSPASSPVQRDLVSFLRDAGERARRGVLENASRVVRHGAMGAGQGDPETSDLVHDDTTMFVTTLQRVHGLALVFGDDVPPQKRRLLSGRLASTMDAVGPRNWRGGTVEVNGGARCEVVRGLRVWLELGACVGSDRWADALGSDAFEQVCAEERKMQEQTHAAELCAASALRLRMVVATRPAHALPAYQDFLGNLSTPTRYPPAPLVALLVDPGGQPIARSSSCPTSPGVIRVNLADGAHAARNAVQQDAPRAQRAAQRSAHAKRLAEQARRVLRARAVVRGDGLSEDEWGEGVRRLAQVVGGWRGILDGVRVVVGRDWKVDEDRGAVVVPFDLVDKG